MGSFHERRGNGMGPIMGKELSASYSGKNKSGMSVHAALSVHVKAGPLGEYWTQKEE